MHRQNFFLVLPLLFMVFLSMKASKIIAIPDSIYCPETTCGDTEIRYPFWMHDSAAFEEYFQCGYPGFGISCSDSNESVIRLSSGNSYEDFFVSNIDYEKYTISLVDADVTTNQNCPRVRHNLTIDQRQAPLYLNDSVDFNLTFYFNCTSAVTWTYAYALDCLKSGTNTSYLALPAGSSDPMEMPPWYDFCEEKVVATVKETWEAINGGSWVNRFGTAMNEGFVLDWRGTRECYMCEISEGYCGFNTTENGDDQFLCICSDGTTTSDICRKGVKGIALIKKIIIGATLAGALILLYIIWYCVRKQCLKGSILLLGKGKTTDDQNLEAVIKQHGNGSLFITPRRYSYSDIKKMTYSFRDKLGEGGFSDVYKGYLPNGVPVAVKLLKTAKGNGEEFINEVASISRTSHVNVITLLGFCLEGTKRALIYEFLSNGSLEKFIYEGKGCDEVVHLELGRIYDIAIGIAQGLEYLHRGCNTRILHFDIKPHNILLDEEFQPKISDFGLAKMCARKESIVSMLGTRGTIGYIAPEVFSRNFGAVSYKSDVYSYGMMVLEMIGGRRNAVNGKMSDDSEAYFPRWVYRRVMLLDEDLKLKERVLTEEENEIARKMIMVGLWCIQTDPSQRPSMSKVIDMLKGGLEDMELPPKPFLCSPSTSRSGGGGMSPPPVTPVQPLETMNSSPSTVSTAASYSIFVES